MTALRPLIACLTIVAVGGCATRPTEAPRYRSIKDTSPAPVHRVAQTTARLGRPEPAPEAAPAPKAEPAQKRTDVAVPPPAQKRTELVLPQRAAPAPLEIPLPQRPLVATEPERAPVVAPPAAPAAAPPPPAVVEKAPETITRPIADARRAAPGEPAVKPTPPEPAPKPVVAAPAKVEPGPAIPAPVASPRAEPTPQPTVTAKAEIAPRIAAISETQRVKSTIARARDYMSAGRVVEARSLLEDAARSGHPDVLFALAETWDPLALRENYPRLARTGDINKAIAAYELARDRGASGTDERIATLKTMTR